MGSRRVGAPVFGDLNGLLNTFRSVKLHFEKLVKAQF